MTVQEKSETEPLPSLLDELDAERIRLRQMLKNQLPEVRIRMKGAPIHEMRGILRVVPEILACGMKLDELKVKHDEVKLILDHANAVSNGAALPKDKFLFNGSLEIIHHLAKLIKYNQSRDK
jgi:hypothetical protein